jgi:hypothetical protein
MFLNTKFVINLYKLDPDRLERILTMVYVVQNSQNFSGLFPPSCIPKNTMFRNLDLFPSSGEGGEKTPTQLGPLERANLNPWAQLHLRTETDPVPKTLCFFFNTGRWKKSRKIM